MRKKLFPFIIILYPVLDIIYGINKQILHWNVPINQILRTLILIYFLSWIKSNKHRLMLLTFSLFLTCGEFYYSVTNIKYHSISTDVSYLLKVLLLVVIIYAVENIIKNNVYSIDDVLKYIIQSTYIITVSIIISPLGLGFHTYSGTAIERFGYKGLFVVQNGVTATLLITAPLCIAMYYRTGLKRYLINYTLITISLFMLGTKAGMVGAAAVLLIQLMNYLIVTNWTKTKKIMALIAGVFILIILFLSKNIIINVIETQQKLLKLFGGDNIYSYLISNRNIQISIVENYINNSHYLFSPIYLFGLGFASINTILMSKKYSVIEMDFYGILYYSGIWVLTFILIIIGIRAIQALIVSIRNWPNSKYNSITLSIVIGIVHAMWGGHVIYEAMTALYFGGVLAIAKMQFEKVQHEVYK